MALTKKAIIVVIFIVISSSITFADISKASVSFRDVLHYHKAFDAFCTYYQMSPFPADSFY